MRRALLLLAVAATMFAACGGDGETVASSELTTSTTVAVTDSTEPQEVTTTDVPPTTERPTTTTAAPATTVPEPEFDVQIDVTVVGDEVTGGGRVEMSQGQTVELVVTADVADEVHVHGYDIFANTQPGQAVTIAFTADLAGIWEVELEQAGLQLVELVVNP